MVYSYFLWGDLVLNIKQYNNQEGAAESGNDSDEEDAGDDFIDVDEDMYNSEWTRGSFSYSGLLCTIPPMNLGFWIGFVLNENGRTTPYR